MLHMDSEMLEDPQLLLEFSTLTPQVCCVV